VGNAGLDVGLGIYSTVADVGWPHGASSVRSRLPLPIGAAPTTILAPAGEEGGPENIQSVVQDLKVDRIDHGVRCLDDPQLVAALEDSGIALTVCPLSNLCLKVGGRGRRRAWASRRVWMFRVQRHVEGSLMATLRSALPNLRGIPLLNTHTHTRTQSITHRHQHHPPTHPPVTGLRRRAGSEAEAAVQHQASHYREQVRLHGSACAPPTLPATLLAPRPVLA
jgi:hypothetical protein